MTAAPQPGWPAGRNPGQPGGPAGQAPGQPGWPAGHIPPGWAAVPGAPGIRTPSGLFPSGPPRPSRPTYREPYPVRPHGLAAGGVAAGVWLLAFGLLGVDLRGYLWWTALAGLVAWLTALTLVRWGDRGVAAGIAMVTAAGWSIAVVAAVARWATTADWPMW